LIGRAAQRAALAALITSADVRLLTLTGPPGVGKTHLALQLAQDLAAQFSGGVSFIDLSPLSEAALVLPTIVQALGLDAQTDRDPAAALQSALRERRTLLVLDNVEQVAGVAPQLAGLLAAAPQLKLLLTSRVALRLRAEYVFCLPPLALPDLAHLPPPDALAQVESVALLLARLRAVRPELALTSANALALAAICVRVDGLPLAIELVASRGSLLSPQELLGEVTLRFRQLRRRSHDVPLRHQTLTAALSWSYDQLSPAAQALFARLSVFVGHWRIDAVEAVCDLEGLGRDLTLDLLDDLVAHSLVQRHDHHGEMRLGMLAMVRTYAHEQLGVRGESAALHQRLLATCIELAERAEEQLLFGAEQAVWMARVEAEHDTIRAALGWALSSGAHTQGLRLAGALWRYWYMRGMLCEGRRWLEQLLALPPTGSPSVRAHALDGLGILAWRQGEYAQAEVWLDAALALYRAAPNRRGEARVLGHIGMVTAERGAFAQALTSYEASLPLYRALGDSVGAASVLHNLGNLHCQQNNHESAMALYRECLAIYEQRGSAADIALISLGIGAVARDQGQAEAAGTAFARSLDLARGLGDEWTAGTALLNIGDIACDRGEADLARQYYAEALSTFERLGDQQQVAVVQARVAITFFLAGDRAAAVERFRQSLLLASALGFHPGVADSLEGLAGCAAYAQPLLAARLFASAAALRERLGMPVALADQQRYAQALRVTQQGDPAAWATAWAEGQAMLPAQAAALALTSVRLLE
ncbi:MAG: tetratricopeptide repeat protein, partial [Oscillochloris sp.]|nr:tetratricopeptide repeat protein [Oscillochloris sp.]